MTYKPKSETEEKYVGGMTGLLEYNAVGQSDRFYVTTITDQKGTEYEGRGSTPEQSERRASREYNKDR